jgi:hypothetical protein
MNAQTEMTDEKIIELAGKWFGCGSNIEDEIGFAREVIAHLTKPDAGGGEELIAKVKAIPVRIEPMGGQRTAYIQRDEVIALLESAPPSDVPAESTVVPMPGLPEELVRLVANRISLPRFTRVEGIAEDIVRTILEHPALIAKYTQTQKESK